MSLEIPENLEAGGLSRLAGLGTVSKSSLPDQIFTSLADALMRGRFSPGERVPIRSIAAALNTSTMPVREAINRLVTIGALEFLPNRRISVPAVSAERYRELARTRTIIEAAAAEAATPLISDDALARLRVTYSDMRLALEHIDDPNLVERYLDLNKTFHFTVYAACGAPQVVAFIETLWLQVGPYLNLTLKDSREWFDTDQHRPILDALIARDPTGVKVAVGQNIWKAAQFVLDADRLAVAEAEVKTKHLNPISL